MPKRIALLGNCQMEVLKDCLEPLTGAEITLYPFASAETAANVDKITDDLAGFDAVGSHQNPPPALAKLRPDALSARMTVLRIPSISFTGFHPDLLTGPNLQPRSPLGIYHSAIVLGCFLAGLPQHRVRSKFNAHTYGQLGYFDEFARAESFLLRSADSIGFDLSPYLPQWMAAGSFMHSPIHPKVRVLADLARIVAKRLGFDSDMSIPVEEYIEDRLLCGVALPVYPEIAARLGVRGSLHFKHHQNVNGRPGTIASLDLLIAASYRAYAKTDWTNCTMQPALAMRDMLLNDSGYAKPQRRAFPRIDGSIEKRLVKILHSPVVAERSQCN